MFLTVVNLAKKSKSKYILVRMVSEAGTGCAFNVKRLRLQEKLVMLSYDRHERPLQRAEKDLFRVTDDWLRRFCEYMGQTYERKY